VAVASPIPISNPAQRATVPCHVCSSSDCSSYIEARGYRIVRCNGCALWYVNPQPTATELREFYATYDDGEQWRNMEEHFNRGVRDAILRFQRSGSVLDVGCGSGNFLRCMQQSGFSAFGIEPSGTGSEYAREEHGIEIFPGMIEDYLTQNPGRRFEAITLLNVLEHLTNPASTLHQLDQLLAPGGVLAVVVPDTRFHDVVGRVRRFLGKPDPYWIQTPHAFLSGFKLPDHLCSFQPCTIAALLQRCGFEVLSIRNAPVVFNATFTRTAAKLLLAWFSHAVHILTFRRVLFGYSTLVVARKA
jgi:SAM-dependent methyltransferase